MEFGAKALFINAMVYTANIVFFLLTLRLLYQAFTSGNISSRGTSYNMKTSPMMFWSLVLFWVLMNIVLLCGSFNVFTNTKWP